MFLDLQTMFSGSVAGTGVKTGDAITATAISSNVLDLRNAATPALADEGLNWENWLVVTVLTAFTAAGAATLTVTLESDSAPGLATAPVVHYATPAIPVASLVAGFVAARVQLPSDNYKRYLGLRYTVATGPMTAGTLTANLAPDIQRNVIYPTGFTIDV
jgi:hypothetical protein